MADALDIAESEIACYCDKWKITELLVFGSAARDELRQDLDLLVIFGPEANWSLLDHVAMTGELSTSVGRPVDLVTRRAVERSPNRIRREAILSSARPYYAARCLGE
jgi:predicted nucleotidyltransferase